MWDLAARTRGPHGFGRWQCFLGICPTCNTPAVGRLMWDARRQARIDTPPWEYSHLTHPTYHFQLLPLFLVRAIYLCGVCAPSSFSSSWVWEVRSWSVLVTSLCHLSHQIGAAVWEVHWLDHGVPENAQIQPETEPGWVTKRLKGETFENRARCHGLPINIGAFESFDSRHPLTAWWSK